MNSADTPLLLIAWRRPHTLRKVIEAIRPVAPTRLFVACDGPNPERPGEAEKVAATREVIETKIDWPCQIERLYSDVNQGCRLGVSRAITWFFEQVEEGIILEDDCVPHADFIAYCCELLDRYRSDSRVWCISGTNQQNGIKRTSDSYYFSQHMHCWGWATWRNRWNHYDVTLSSWLELNANGWTEGLFDSPSEYLHWKKIWDQAAFGFTSTWDVQWYYCCFINSGLVILPSRSLICNIGFGSDATHSTGDQLVLELESAPVFPLKHPRIIRPHRAADRYTTKTEFMKEPIKQKSPFSRIYRRLRLRNKLIKFYQMLP